MRRVRGWWMRVIGAAARGRRERDFADELESHIHLHIEDNLRAGMTPGEARRRALVSLGGVTQVQEAWRDQRGLPFLEHCLQDIRYGARVLRRSPAFAVVAIVTLALGTGANAAIFQLIDAVQFQPLPVPRPYELTLVGIERHGKPRVGMAFRGGVHTEPLWQAIRERQQVFAHVFAWGNGGWDSSTDGEAAPVLGLYVSGGFFAGLDLHPQVGRLFVEDDDRAGCGAPGAVISHAFWAARYARDPAVVGRTLVLNGRPFEILGVAPAGFDGLEVGRTFHVAVPICAEPLLRGPRPNNAVWWLDVMGRLRPGMSVEQAGARLASISGAVFESTIPPTYNAEMAAHYAAATLIAVPAATGVSRVRTDYATHLWLLLGLTGLVLLITCANLANLLLARATAREREIAVRLALGASRRRVVRQFAVETLLLAGVGVAAGGVVATWLSAGLVALMSPEGSPIVLDLRPDWRLLGFMAAVAVVTATVIGVVPALRATRVDPGAALHAGGRSATDADGALGFRRVLVVVQVAISLVLIVAAVLFARSLTKLSRVDPGFRPDVIVSYIDLRRTGAAPDARRQLLTRIVDRFAALPGVRGAAEAFIVPLSGPDWNGRIVIGGQRQDGDVRFNAVGTDYFGVLETRVVAGRTFAAGDGPEAPRRAVVNETFAKRYFAGERAVGRTFRMEATPGAPQPTYEIVGVVHDCKYGDVREGALPVAYFATSQDASSPPVWGVLVRADLPFASVTPALTRTVRELAPGASVSHGTLGEHVQALLLTDRLMSTLSASLGLLALVVAMVGLYGVMSYTVARRQVEIGIRMALGADSGTVARMMLAESGVLIAAGCGLGVLASVAVLRSTSQVLYGLSAADPWSFAAAIATLATIGALACWIPARRAARLAPTVAIRE